MANPHIRDYSFKKGDSRINRAGRPPGTRSLLDRLWHFLEMTPKDLQKYLGPAEALWQRDDVPLRDILMAIHVRACVSGGKGQGEREAILDRYEGRPTLAIQGNMHHEGTLLAQLMEEADGATRGLHPRPRSKTDKRVPIALRTPSGPPKSQPATTAPKPTEQPRHPLAKPPRRILSSKDLQA